MFRTDFSQKFDTYSQAVDYFNYNEFDNEKYAILISGDESHFIICHHKDFATATKKGYQEV